MLSVWTILLRVAAIILRTLADNPNFEFREQDVSNYIDIEGDLDYILHFASPASPIHYVGFAIQTLKVGSLAIHNCLGLAKAKTPVSSLRLRAKCMATRSFTRKPKSIGDTSIRLGIAVCMTKRSGFRKQ